MGLIKQQPDTLHMSVCSRRENYVTPSRASAGAAGYDLHADISPGESITIRTGCVAIIPCGFRLSIPPGYEAQLRSRSGLSTKRVTVANSPGTIDSDYRGEVAVILQNDFAHPFHVQHGDRIAQMVFAKVKTFDFILTDELPETVRGAGGFGSTGTN
jgi:dUTP pyrophosphatase